MSSLEDLESLTREELLALLAQLQRQVAELTASNAYGDREEFDRWVLEVRLVLSYHQRGYLLRFLEQPEVEPTNTE